MKRLPSLLVAGAIIAATVGFSPNAALADKADEFLKAMEGDYRGRGTAKLPGRQDAERVACKVNNRFDAGARSLAVSGDCATAQAKSKVSGKLTLAGQTVKGTFISSLEGVTVTKSVGAVGANNQLVVNTSMVDNATGNLTRVRQIITLSDKGFKAQFFTYDNGKSRYELSGSMDFSRT